MCKMASLTQGGESDSEGSQDGLEPGVCLATLSQDVLWLRVFWWTDLQGFYWSAKKPGSPDLSSENPRRCLRSARGPRNSENNLLVLFLWSLHCSHLNQVQPSRHGEHLLTVSEGMKGDGLWDFQKPSAGGAELSPLGKWGNHREQVGSYLHEINS